MKKVVATVLVKDYEIINLTINDNKGTSLTLTPSPSPMRFHSTEELYGYVLEVLKNNGFYTHVYKEFGKSWYNIQVIDLNNPSITSVFGIKERRI